MCMIHLINDKYSDIYFHVVVVNSYSSLISQLNSLAEWQIKKLLLYEY
jgi:hypothetical protein